MKGFFVILACLIAVLLAAFQPQIKCLMFDECLAPWIDPEAQQQADEEARSL